MFELFGCRQLSVNRLRWQCSQSDHRPPQTNGHGPDNRRETQPNHQKRSLQPNEVPPNGERPLGSAANSLRAADDSRLLELDENRPSTNKLHSPSSSETRPLAPKDRYLLESRRFKIFGKHSSIVHEIDQESRQLVAWTSAPVQGDQSWRHVPDHCTNSTLIDAFEQMLAYSSNASRPLSEPCFDRFTDQFVTSLPTFSANQLLRAVQLFARHPIDWQSCRQRNYIELHMAMDQQSTIQASHFTNDQLIFMASIWLRLPNAVESYLAQRVCRLLNRNIKTMSARQLVPTLYYLRSFRRKVEDFGVLQMVLGRTMDDMTIEEIAIVVGALAQYAAKLSSAEWRAKFVERLMAEDLSQLHETFVRPMLLVSWTERFSSCSSRLPFS